MMGRRGLPGSSSSHLRLRQARNKANLSLLHLDQIIFGPSREIKLLFIVLRAGLSERFSSTGLVFSGSPKMQLRVFTWLTRLRQNYLKAV